MPDVRSLTYVLELIDNATKPLKDASKIASDLDSSVSKVSVSADVSGATKSLSSLAGLGEEVGGKLSKAGEQAAQAGGKIKEVWDPATQSVITFREEVAKTETQLNKLGSGIGNLTSKIGEYRKEILAVQVATGGLLGMSVKAAAENERLAGAVTAVFGESSEKILKWAEAAEHITGATKGERMEMVLLFKEMGQGAEQSMKSAETVEKFWRNTALRQRAQAAGISSKEQLTQELRMADVGGRTLGLRRIFGKDAMENISEYGGAKKVLSLMNKEIEKTGKTGMDTQKAMGEFNEVVGELSESIGTMFLPPITKLFQILTKVISILKDIPGVPQFIGLAAAIGFVVSSGILLTYTLAKGIGSIIKMAVEIRKLSLITKLHTVVTYAWAAAQAVANGLTKALTASIGFLGNAFKALKAIMMSNPWIAAFTILLAVVIALEMKFHIFEKIFEKLSKIDWAGKLASGLEYVSKLWDGLTGKLGSMGSLGSIAKPIIAVTMPGLTLMAGLLKLMIGLAKPFIETATPAIKYLKDIYNIIKEKFESAIKYLKDIVPDWLKSIFEAVGNFISWVTEKIGILLSILGIREKTAAGSGEEPATATITPEQQLAYNQSRFAMEQASGGERGLPAIGTGEMKGWISAFGGKYNETTFKSSRYPGQERLGRDLTEAQLMTGEWTPTAGEDEFKAFLETRKKMQEESEAQEGQKEYTSIFDEILSIARGIWDTISTIYGWLKDTLLKTIQDLGSMFQSGIPESQIESALKNKMQEKRIAEGRAPYSEEQLQYLVDYAMGKDTGKIPQGLTGVDIKDVVATYEGLKSGKVAPATTSTGTNLTATVNKETGEITGGKALAPKEVAASARIAPTSGEIEIPINEPTLQERIRNQGTSTTVTTNTAPLLPIPIPKAQTGGAIEKTGLAVVHEGEEVISPEGVKTIRGGTIPSILEEIDNLVYKMSGKTFQRTAPISEPSVNLNFYAPVVKVDKMSSEIDLYKIKSELVSFLRKEVKSAMKGGM